MNTFIDKRTIRYKRACRWIACCCLALFLSASPALKAESGDTVVVVYNSLLPESKAVAEHYADRREVPKNQVLGLPLPTSETMTRAEFRQQLQTPLRKWLEEHKLFLFGTPAKSTNGTMQLSLKQAKIRYAVLCYGVPLRVLNDPHLADDGRDNTKAELRGNGAAVDSELAWLPWSNQKVQLTGPLANPLYGATNAAVMQPTNGVLMVARLDGPTATIAQNLVDKAIEAETNGLWGRAYFDARGETNASMKLGDDWIRAAAQTTSRFGFESVLDQNPGTFPSSFPMCQIAFYAGWYDPDVSGPLAQPRVEFMPGAFAYHLHSFSAATLRSTRQHWCGPLLNAGATATMGCVDEPYLGTTPDLAVFFSRFLNLGFSFGEAAWACQNSLSWQNTVVGDPLYRPFGKKPQQQHAELAARKSKLLEWSHLRVVNLNLALNSPIAELVSYLEGEPLTKQSAILSEKLGELYLAQGKTDLSIQSYERALKLDPSPQQRINLQLTLARVLEAAKKDADAIAVYKELIAQSPDFPGKAGVEQRIHQLSATK